MKKEHDAHHAIISNPVIPPLAAGKLKGAAKVGGDDSEESDDDHAHDESSDGGSGSDSDKDQDLEKGLGRG